MSGARAVAPLNDGRLAGLSVARLDALARLCDGVEPVMEAVFYELVRRGVAENRLSLSRLLARIIVAKHRRVQEEIGTLSELLVELSPQSEDCSAPVASGPVETITDSSQTAALPLPSSAASKDPSWDPGLLSEYGYSGGKHSTLSARQRKRVLLGLIAEDLPAFVATRTVGFQEKCTAAYLASWGPPDSWMRINRIITALAMKIREFEGKNGRQGDYGVAIADYSADVSWLRRLAQALAPGHEESALGLSFDHSGRDGDEPPDQGDGARGVAYEASDPNVIEASSHGPLPEYEDVLWDEAQRELTRPLESMHTRTSNTFPWSPISIGDRIAAVLAAGGDDEEPSQ